MRTNTEFEQFCSLLMDGARCHGAMPEMSVDTGNLFYENYGMSAEEVQEMFCRGERLG